MKVTAFVCPCRGRNPEDCDSGISGIVHLDDDGTTFDSANDKIRTIRAAIDKLNAPPQEEFGNTKERAYYFISNDRITQRYIIQGMYDLRAEILARALVHAEEHLKITKDCLAFDVAVQTNLLQKLNVDILSAESAALKEQNDQRQVKIDELERQQARRGR